MNIKNLIIALVILLVVFFAVRGRMALWACRQGYLVIVKTILLTGLDINTRDGDGHTLLLNASTRAIFNFDDIDEKKDEQKKATPLMEYRYKKKLVRYLIEKGADINATGKDGRWNVLTVAVSHDDAEDVKYYLSKGADPKIKHDRDYTMLMMTGNIEITRMLVEGGAEVNAAATNGFTALMRAKDAEIVKFLISKGANVNARSKDGRTVLQRALDSKDYIKAKLIENAGGRK